MRYNVSSVWSIALPVIGERVVVLQGSAEASLCKYGLYLLRAALTPAAHKALPWSTFLVLYELLDEYALHLIQVPSPPPLLP